MNNTLIIRPRKRLFKKRVGSEKAIYIIVFIIFAVYSISMIYPFIWMFINSFKPFAHYSLDMARGKAFAMPIEWRFENYVEVFSMIETPDGIGFFEMIFNNLWQSILPLIINMLTTTYFSYIMSRFKFPGRQLIYSIIIFVMTVPIVGTSGAHFKLISDLGLYNTPFYVMVCSIGGFGGFGFMVYYAFFKNVPYSYAEAVYMDGGGEFTVFFKIILPQAKAIIVTIAISGFIGSWNDYLGPLLYMPSYPTIASGMYLVRNTLIRSGKNPLYYAGLLTTMIPILIVFISFSDVIMESMSIGGLKG